MQFVLTLSMNYDMKHFFLPLVLVERTRLCVHYENREPVCVLHSGQMLAAFMVIKKWNKLKCYHGAKHGSPVSALWKDVLDLNRKHSDT